MSVFLVFGYIVIRICCLFTERVRGKVLKKVNFWTLKTFLPSVCPISWLITPTLSHPGVVIEILCVPPAMPTNDEHPPPS